MRFGKVKESGERTAAPRFAHCTLISSSEKQDRRFLPQVVDVAPAISVAFLSRCILFEYSNFFRREEHGPDLLNIR